MIRRSFVAVLLALAPAGLSAQADAPGSLLARAETSSLEGSWALRFDGAIIFRFDVEREGAGWRGTWTRPRSFASDGDRFSGLTGAMTVKSDKGGAIGEWAELSFPDNRPGAVPDVFRLHLLDKDTAELIYVGTGLAPYTLERVAADALLGPFEEGKIYRRPGMVAARRPSPAPDPASKPAPAPARQGPPAMKGR